VGFSDVPRANRSNLQAAMTDQQAREFVEMPAVPRRNGP
jgi:hypothetical protein